MCLFIHTCIYIYIYTYIHSGIYILIHTQDLYSRFVHIVHIVLIVEYTYLFTQPVKDMFRWSCPT